MPLFAQIGPELKDAGRVRVFLLTRRRKRRPEKTQIYVIHL